MIMISVVAKEKSTFILDVALVDENGSAATPKTMKWSLVDDCGRVINARDGVLVAQEELASSVSIVLSGDDLLLQSEEMGRYAKRHFVIEATYDGDHGDDLPVNEEAVFIIENLSKIT